MRTTVLTYSRHSPRSNSRITIHVNLLFSLRQRPRAIACRNQLKRWLPDQLLVQIHWREIESVGCGMDLPPEYTRNRHAIALGSGLTLVGAIYLYKSVALYLMGTVTTGKIVNVEQRLRRGNSNRKKVYYHPVIEFSDHSGSSRRFVFKGGSTRGE